MLFTIAIWILHDLKDLIFALIFSIRIRTCEIRRFIFPSSLVGFPPLGFFLELHCLQLSVVIP